MTGRLIPRFAVYALLVLAGLAAPLVSRAQAPSADPWTQVITAGEIREAAPARLTDLFALADGWHGFSIDGYTWHMSAGALAPPQEPAWHIVVDGVPVDLRVLGSQGLNLLPFHPAQLDSVVVTRVPSIVAGMPSFGGTIHLITRRPPRGLGVAGAVGLGNEIDDPGPLRYLDETVPNVDRVGPVAWAGLLGGGRHLGATVSVLADEYHVTDDLLVRRTRRSIEDPKPRVLVQSPGLSIHHDASSSRHRLSGAVSVVDDLLFQEAAGREWPFRQRLTYLGLSGALGDVAAPRLTYRMSFRAHTLGLRSKGLTLWPDWRQDHYAGHAAWHGQRPGMAASVGVGIDVYQVHTERPLGEPLLLLPSGYSALTLVPHPTFRQQITLALTYSDGRVVPKALLTVAYQPTRALGLHAVAGYSAQDPAAENSFWYWMNEGYDLLQRSGIRAEGLPSTTLGGTLTADAALRLQPARPLAFELRGLFRRFESQTVPAYSLQFNPYTEGLAVRTRQAPDVSGDVAGGGLSVAHRPGSRFEQRIEVEHLRVLAGDSVYTALWDAYPGYRASYTLRYRPVERFSLHGRVRFQDAVDWPAYRLAAIQSRHRYDPTLPHAVLVDVAATKRFWGDHLDVNVALRNLLNTPYRTHPAGAVFRMTLDVRATLSF